MKIRSVRCVEYAATMEHPEEFWEQRLIRPVDIYPGFQAQGPEFLPRAGASAYRVDSVFVHVDVDTGEYGTAGPISREQAHHILTGMAPLLVGQDPLATEALWDQLHRFCIHGRKGVEMQAISALDCALWDFKGKHFGVPVHVLLGGSVRAEIPAYASALGYSLEPDLVRARAAQFVQEGFRATKWFPRWGPADGKSGMARNEELVRALREAVGPDVDIMIDAWSSWDVPYTLRMAERLADYAPHWIEEPVLADKIDSYAEITARMPNNILVAGGEHEYTRWGLGKLMSSRAMHVFQPDTYWAGGISEMLKIATLASTHDVTLIPHGHSVPANAHLSFALPVSLAPMLEYLVKWNMVHQYLLADPVRPVNGVVHPPQQPGLGMELDENKIEGRTELRP